MFVDRVTLKIRAGRGGDGAISFLREKYVPRGGPAGGTGGDGGSVILRASEHKKTLYDVSLKRSYEAPSGQPGRKKNQSGQKGGDLILDLPVGTQVFDHLRNVLMTDLVVDGQEVVIVRGGRGGRGNASFATSENQAPRVAEKGEEGEAGEIRLELKLIADAGISGLPNAGKSTLLSVVSAARPQIADYPFTTLRPYLGVVDHRSFRFIMVDIPGIIEGASEGAGLGFEFLRHVERTRLILHCVDCSPLTGNHPVEDFYLLRKEFEKYSPSLASKPFFVVATKLDIPEAKDAFLQFKSTWENDDTPVFGISAVTGEGLSALLDAVVLFLEKHPVETVLADVFPESGMLTSHEVSLREYRFSTPYLARLITEIDWKEPDAISVLNRTLINSGFMKYFHTLRPQSQVEIGEKKFLWTGKKLVAFSDESH